MATEEDDVPGGKGEHLKFLAANAAAMEGHLSGMAEEVTGEGKRLFAIAKTQIELGVLAAEKAIRNHLPETK